MEKDCGAWINILAHKVKKRLDATLQDIGITGVQSRVIYYILNHYEDGPEGYRKCFRIKPFNRYGHIAAS